MKAQCSVCDTVCDLVVGLGDQIVFANHYKPDTKEEFGVRCEVSKRKPRKYELPMFSGILNLFR